MAEAPVGAPAAAPVGAGASGSGGDAPAAAEGAVGSSAGELPRQIARAWSGSMPSPHIPRAGIAKPCAHRPTGNRPSTGALLRLAPLLLCWVRAEQDRGGHATGGQGPRGRAGSRGRWAARTEARLLRSFAVEIIMGTPEFEQVSSYRSGPQPLSRSDPLSERLFHIACSPFVVASVSGTLTSHTRGRGECASMP